MKVSSSRVRLIPAILALPGVMALVLAGVVGVGFVPPQTAEAATALRLNGPSAATAAAGVIMDAAAKSAMLRADASTAIKAASATKVATTIVRTPPHVVHATTVSRGSSGTGAWSTAKVSWYGPGFYGNTMAGGGTLTPTSMVVAHRSMAFGTRIEFQYKGRTCVAVVQDRGPYVSGRLFDLGPGTAKALGFSGVGTVSYRILGR